MKKSVGANPYIFPLPVLIIGTYSEDGSADAMNAAWGVVSDYKQVCLYLDGTHKTVKNIKKRGAFTVSIADEKHVIPSDYVGIVSGNKEPNKISKSGFKISKSQKVDAPIIDDLPLVLECELDYIDEKTGGVYGKIVDVLADESVLTDGKVDITKLSPITYDASNHGYYGIGKKVGQAFSDGKALM